jgi:CheY-like chemotaxis protein
MTQIRVLLADDREAERADMVECLNHDPRFNAHECGLSREEVQYALNAERWDVLVLDVELRSAENRTADAVDQTFGLKLLREIHAQLEERGIKVALLTIHDVRVSGSMVAASIRELLDLGYAHAYLRKPFIPSHHIPVLAGLVAGPERPQEDL